MHPLKVESDRVLVLIPSPHTPPTDAHLGYEVGKAPVLRSLRYVVRIRRFPGTSTLIRRLRRHQAPASPAHLESARHLDHVLQEGRHITPSKCYRRHPQIPHSPLGFVSLAGLSHQPWALCLHSTRPKVLSVAQPPAQVPLACQYSHGESVQSSRARWPTLLRPAASGAFR